jgi:hypothetical protein
MVRSMIMRFNRAGSCLDAHSLQIVQRVQETGQITSISQLITRDIVFKHCAVDVIVCRIAVHKSVQEEGVEWKAPIVRRFRVGMSLPLSRVLEWIERLLLRVQVPFELPFVVWCSNNQRCQRAEDPHKSSLHFRGASEHWACISKTEHWENACDKGRNGRSWGMAAHVLRRSHDKDGRRGLCQLTAIRP